MWNNDITQSRPQLFHSLDKCAQSIETFYLLLRRAFKTIKETLFYLILYNAIII